MLPKLRSTITQLSYRFNNLTIHFKTDTGLITLLKINNSQAMVIKKYLSKE